MRMIERVEPRQTALFLFNYSKRQLHGVFEAPEAGGLNLEPEAWKETGRFAPRAGQSGNVMTNNKTAAEESPFPAQVRFNVVHHFPPLPEKLFSHIVRYRGNTHNFEFTLDAQQVADLM